MIAAALILLILSSLVAIGNLVGCVRATKEHGYSSVPVLSLLMCTIAYASARDIIGLWAFLPTVLDPGTWVLFILPVYLVYRRLFADKRNG
jgi:hypothetical protein